MADLDAARRELEDALGADAVLSTRSRSGSTPATPRWSRARPALVVFPRSTDDVVACVRAAAAHDLRCRSPRERHGARRRVHADRRRPRGGHVEDGPDPRDPAGGPPRVGGAGPVQPRPRHRAPRDGLHVHARPVLAAGVVDRRQRGDERGRAALPRVRRHVRPRAGARRRARRRDRGARGLGGPGGGRLRPPRGGRRVGGDDRARHRRVRAPHARAAGDRDDAAGLRDGRGLRGDGLGDHRAAASCRRPSR